MATTTPRNYVTPDSGSNYNLTVDLAALADTINDDAVMTANYGVGTTASRIANLGKFNNGALWYDTTTSSEWRKVSGSWVNQDTGWVNISSALSGGFTGSVFARSLNGVGEVYGTVTGSFPAGGTTTDFLNTSGVPSTARPSGATRFTNAWFGGYAGSVVVRSNGSLGVSQNTVNWTSVQFSGTWII